MDVEDSPDDEEFQHEFAIGKRYPLRCLLAAHKAITAIQFSFKPGDVDTTVPMPLQLNQSTGEATLAVSRTSTSGTDDYKGGVSSSSERDFVIVYNASIGAFELRKVSLMVNQLKFREKIDDA